MSRGERSMSRKFTGRTEDAQNVFLGASFWKQGTRVGGRVVDSFTTRSDSGLQTCYSIETDGVEVNGETVEKVAIGGLVGFRMALRAAMGGEELACGDFITIECTGTTPAKKKGNSDQINFSVEVVRPHAVEPSRPERAVVPF